MTAELDEQATAADGARPSPRAVIRAARSRWLGGDGPWALAFLGVLVLAVVVVSGPVRTWATQRDLVETRQAELGALEAENDRLADRVEDLNDPATIEGQAREDMGMYRPGEVPYEVVRPEVDQPQLRPEAVTDDSDRPGWLERLRQAVADVFG